MQCRHEDLGHILSNFFSFSIVDTLTEGAKTFRRMTLSIKTLSIALSVAMLSVHSLIVMLSVVFSYCYAECHCDKCRNALAE